MDLWEMAQQLEKQKQRDPQAAVLLIYIYEQILDLLEFNEEARIYASIQSKLGKTYLQLPIDNRAGNLTRAIACFQETLRVWTPQANPLKYATAQDCLGAAYTVCKTDTSSPG